MGYFDDFNFIFYPRTNSFSAYTFLLIAFDYSSCYGAFEDCLIDLEG